MDLSQVERQAAAAADDDLDRSTDESTQANSGGDEADFDWDSDSNGGNASDYSYHEDQIWEIQVVLRLENNPNLLRDEPIKWRNGLPRHCRLLVGVNLWSDPQKAGRRVLRTLQPRLPFHSIDSTLDVKLIEKPRTVDLNEADRQRLGRLRECVLQALRSLVSTVTMHPTATLSFKMKNHPAVPYTSVMGRRLGAICRSGWLILSFTWSCMQDDFMDAFLDASDRRCRWWGMDFADEIRDESRMICGDARPMASSGDLLAKARRHRSCPQHMDLHFHDVTWPSMSKAMKEILNVEDTLVSTTGKRKARRLLSINIGASTWSSEDLCSFFRCMGGPAKSSRVKISFFIDNLDWETWKDDEIERVVESLKEQEFRHHIHFDLFQKEDKKSLVNCFRSIVEASSPKPLIRKIYASGYSEPLLRVMSGCKWGRSAILHLDYSGSATWRALEVLLQENTSLRSLNLTLRDDSDTESDEPLKRSTLPSSLFRAVGENVTLRHLDIRQAHARLPNQDRLDAWVDLCIKRNQLLRSTSMPLWPRVFANAQQRDNNQSLVFDVLRRRVDDLCKRMEMNDGLNAVAVSQSKRQCILVLERDNVQ